MTRLPAVEEKPRFVSAMFGRIARRYDVMNRLMSMGMDEGWRRAVAEEARLPVLGGDVLDVGTGTGRLGLAIARQMDYRGRVVGVDFSEPMLRARKQDVRIAMDVAAADGLRLPFRDGSFDAVVSAFVVRNLADVSAGIREQARMLRPGGRLVVLEITPGPRNPILRALFRVYFRGIVPFLGGLIAGDSAAYTYLPESAAVFLEPERLTDLLRHEGLSDVCSRRLSMGSVAITSGTR